MAANGFAAELQKEIDPLQEKVMHHPLYQAIYDGKLPIPVLREYAKQAYLWKSYAQELIPVLIPKSPPDIRRLLIKNLVSEEGLGNEPPHLQLLVEFGEEIGMQAKARRVARIGLEHRWVAVEGIYRRFGGA